MLLSVDDLVVDVPGDAGALRVLDHVSMSVEAGELVDVVGDSGAGKTMLLRSLARLLPDVRGSLALRGVSASGIPAYEWRSRVALLPQKVAVRPGTVGDNLLWPWSLKVRHGRNAPSREELASALERLNLSDVSLDRDVARLSVGQAARIALLRVLLTRPDVLLLDEPDANLDDASAEQVARATAQFVEQGGGAVRVRHHRSDGLASRRLRLYAGRLESEEA